jgi:hypothetical protein
VKVPREVRDVLDSYEARGYQRARHETSEARRVLMREILSQMRLRGSRSLTEEELYMLWPKETA